MRHFLLIKEITANISSLFDLLQDISKHDPSEFKELFQRIIEKMDEYEVKIEVLNNNLTKEKSQNVSIFNELESIKNEITILKNNNNKINSEIYNLNDEIYYMDKKLIEINQYARRESIIISGIPDNVKHDKLEETVLFILRSIGLVSIASYNISACHRLMKKTNDRHPAQTIIRFTNRKIVNFCLENRIRLFEQRNFLKMNLRFFESLCTENKQVYDKCFDLKKYGLITDFYIRNGFVKIVKDGNRIIKIHHPDDLNYYFKNYYESNDLYNLSSSL